MAAHRKRDADRRRLIAQWERSEQTAAAFAEAHGSVRFVGPDGGSLRTESTFELRLTEDYGFCSAAVQNVQFDGPGVYAFEILIREKVLRSVPLRISLRRQFRGVQH